MMPEKITCSCPGCGKALQVPDKLANKKIECGGCRKVFVPRELSREKGSDSAEKIDGDVLRIKVQDNQTLVTEPTINPTPGRSVPIWGVVVSVVAIGLLGMLVGRWRATKRDAPGPVTPLMSNDHAVALTPAEVEKLKTVLIDANLKQSLNELLDVHSKIVSRITVGTNLIAYSEMVAQLLDAHKKIKIPTKLSKSDETSIEAADLLIDNHMRALKAWRYDIETSEDAKTRLKKNGRSTPDDFRSKSWELAIATEDGLRGLIKLAEITAKKLEELEHQ